MLSINMYSPVNVLYDFLSATFSSLASAVRTQSEIPVTEKMCQLTGLSGRLVQSTGGY